MAEPFLGEIRTFAFSYAPKGWALCNGQTLPVAQNQALFSLLGTNYGGDGFQNFALPNFQTRVPVHTGNDGSVTWPQGQSSGAADHTLTLGQIPSHSHSLVASTATDARRKSPTTQSALVADRRIYGPTPANGALSGNALAPAGSNQPHQNQMPTLTVLFCIATVGIYPSRP